MERQDQIRKLAEWMGWETGTVRLLGSNEDIITAIKPDQLPVFWNPFDRIEDAWELVEKIEKWCLRIDENGSIMFDIYLPEYPIVGYGKTAPEAICLAMLEMLKEDK